MSSVIGDSERLCEPPHDIEERTVAKKSPSIVPYWTVADVGDFLSKHSEFAEALGAKRITAGPISLSESGASRVLTATLNSGEKLRVPIEVRDTGELLVFLDSAAVQVL